MLNRLKLKKNCEVCGIEFRVLTKEQKYCSRKCYFLVWKNPMVNVESRIKISKALTGKRKSEETIKKLVKSHLGKVGELASNWKGGIPKRESYKKWVEKNRSKKYFLNLKRKCIKKNILGSHTLKEWENLKISCQNKCVWCGRDESEIVLTQDHINPISKNGTDYISNIQPLCRSCNSKKKDSFINFLIQEKGVEFYAEF